MAGKEMEKSLWELAQGKDGQVNYIIHSERGPQ